MICSIIQIRLFDFQIKKKKKRRLLNKSLLVDNLSLRHCY